PGHRLRDRELGGGALLDLGVYPVSLAHLVLGAPASVTAWAALGPEGTDENTGLLLGYASGAVATLHCGFVGATGQRATITGTDGRIDVPAPFFRPDGFTIVRSGVAERVELPVRGNGFGYEAQEVMACLRAGRTESELIPLAATVATMRILDAARAQIGV